MYLTSDGQESILAIADEVPESSVESMDVLKAGEIISETPLGRMSFTDYFNHIEKEIATEVAGRKADIASVRAQMAKDFAFNAASRAKLKRNMMHKMAQYAKKARDELNHAMQRTQERFAKQANLANRRHRATLRRSKRTMKLINHDKREQAKQLSLAVSSWQKHQSAWASATNAHINRMNAHASANAAQIKENARKARKDLEATMGQWDHKVAKFRSDSKTARGKLAAQFAAQGKATSAWANNKIKGLVASTAAQFNDVETKMAKNRAEVDGALKAAVMRFAAALNAQKALEAKRFASAQAGIAATRAEAEAKTKQMEAGFKTQLITLSSTVKEQVSKVNSRIDDAASVVRSDSAAQAKVNANVNAEMGRMIKLGNDRYKKHLVKHMKMGNKITADQAETDAKINQMAKAFNAQLAGVRKQLKKDRAHAENKLQKQTSAVWEQLAKNQDAQAHKNAEMKANTRRVRLDAMDAVRKAKLDFQRKIKNLGKVVAKNDKKADKKIKALAGIVHENAQKDRKGREQLASLEEANKLEMKHSIADAIKKGEARAKAVEAKGKKMDKDTQFLVNSKLNAEITKLREETNGSVESLALQSKEARAEMQKEMLYAIRSAAEVAKEDLNNAINDGVKKMDAYQKKATESHAKSELERAALKEEIEANAKAVSDMIKDAVATDARAQTALGQETAASLKKTNTALDAHAKQMQAIATKTRQDISAQANGVLGQLKDMKSKAKKATEKLQTDDAKRKMDALNFVEQELKKAAAETDVKFGQAYEKMAKTQGHSELALGGAVDGLNKALAKQAALEEAMFAKSVVDLDSAKKAAAADVATLRKDFATQLMTTTALAKNSNQKLADNIAKASGEVQQEKALQARITRQVGEEIHRIEKLANDRHSEDTRARGKLRMIMNQDKMLAASEIEALAKDLEGKVSKLRAYNAQTKRQNAKDLTEATTKMYGRLADYQDEAKFANDKLNGQTEEAKLEAASALAASKEQFNAKILGLTNNVVANAAKAERDMARLTGVVHDFAKASKEDVELIKKQTITMEADLNKALEHAISKGEADAKAAQQRINEHVKDAKRFLLVELGEATERAADNVLASIEGSRQKIADNYLSFKAYAVGASDMVDDYVAKGAGKALSALGDLMTTVGNMGAVRAPDKEGIGLGGNQMPTIFSGKTVKVSSSINVVNGLVDEYTQSVDQVKLRWPMGLGKYLLDKLEMSMHKKGVLQVEKVEGKNGQFVFINARSVGLSNKMRDFQKLALRMSTYESVLAKLTAKIQAPQAKPLKKPYYVPMDKEWEGQ
jgi:hypothetical protein